MNLNVEMTTENTVPNVSHPTLAAWRAALVNLRDEERRRGAGLSPDTGRLLETVGQVLAKGGGVLLPDDISAIATLTGITVRYHEVHEAPL